MERFSQFKNSILRSVFKVTLIFCVFFRVLDAWSLAGRQAENGPQTSSELTVRHVLDMQRPPFVHLTPSRPTIVQFPAEVRNCVIKSNLISLAYGNGESVSSSSSSDKDSKNQGNGSNAIYSAVTLSVEAVENFTYDDMLNTPETYMICSIKSNRSDSFCQGYADNQNTYCFVTIGIKIENTDHYNAIVYLDKPGSNSALAPLPVRSDLSKNRKKEDTISFPENEKTEIKSVIVKSQPQKNSDSNFKISPLPKNQFKEDRVLGLQADMAINK